MSSCAKYFMTNFHSKNVYNSNRSRSNNGCRGSSKRAIAMAVECEANAISMKFMPFFLALSLSFALSLCSLPAEYLPTKSCKSISSLVNMRNIQLFSCTNWNNKWTNTMKTLFKCCVLCSLLSFASSFHNNNLSRFVFLLLPFVVVCLFACEWVCVCVVRFICALSFFCTLVLFHFYYDYFVGLFFIFCVSFARSKNVQCTYKVQHAASIAKCLG